MTLAAPVLTVPEVTVTIYTPQGVLLAADVSRDCASGHIIYTDTPAGCDSAEIIVGLSYEEIIAKGYYTAFNIVEISQAQDLLTHAAPPLSGGSQKYYLNSNLQFSETWSPDSQQIYLFDPTANVKTIRIPVLDTGSDANGDYLICGIALDGGTTPAFPVGTVVGRRRYAGHLRGPRSRPNSKAPTCTLVLSGLQHALDSAVGTWTFQDYDCGVSMYLILASFASRWPYFNLLQESFPTVHSPFTENRQDATVTQMVSDIIAAIATGAQWVLRIAHDRTPRLIALYTDGGTYDALILSEPSVAHYWPCNDAVGATTITDVVGGDDLSIVGDVTLGAPALLADLETTASFPRTGGYATGPAVLPYSTTSSVTPPFTIEMWATNIDGNNGNTSRPFYFFGTSLGAAGPALICSGWPDYRLVGDPGFVYKVDSMFYEGDKYAAYTWDGSVGTWYAGNGVSGGTIKVVGTSSTSPATSGGTIIFGADSTFADTWFGTMAKLATYSTALSAADILTHVQAGFVTRTNTSAYAYSITLHQGTDVYEAVDVENDDQDASSFFNSVKVVGATDPQTKLPAQALVQDATSIAVYGQWDATPVSVQGVTTEAGALATATSLLNQYSAPRSNGSFSVFTRDPLSRIAAPLGTAAGDSPTGLYNGDLVEGFHNVIITDFEEPATDLYGLVVTVQTTINPAGDSFQDVKFSAIEPDWGSEMAERSNALANQLKSSINPPAYLDQYIVSPGAYPISGGVPSPFECTVPIFYGQFGKNTDSVQLGGNTFTVVKLATNFVWITKQNTYVVLQAFPPYVLDSILYATVTTDESKIIGIWDRAAVGTVTAVAGSTGPNLVQDSDFAQAHYDQGLYGGNDSYWSVNGENEPQVCYTNTASPAPGAFMVIIREESSGVDASWTSMPIPVNPGLLIAWGGYMDCRDCSGTMPEIQLVPGIAFPNSDNDATVLANIAGVAGSNATLTGTYSVPLDGSVQAIAFRFRSLGTTIGKGSSWFGAVPSIKHGGASGNYASGVTPKLVGGSGDVDVNGSTTTTESGDTITTPPITDQQYLTYRAATKTYIGTSPALAVDADVDTTTAAPGYVLAAATSNGKPFSFVPAAKTVLTISDVLTAENGAELTTESGLLLMTDTQYAAPSGDSTSIGVTASAIAAVALSGQRVVVQNAAGQYVYDDSTLGALASLPPSLTQAAYAAGALAETLQVGTMVEPSWNWTPGAPVFVGTNGILTQIVPSSAAGDVFLLQVGVALTATTLQWAPRAPLTLA